MAGAFCMLFIFVSFSAFSCGLNVLSATIECRNQCERTYPLHTYPSVGHLLACQRGCYYAVKQKLTTMGVRMHNHKCSKECENHFTTGSYYACKLGCVKGKAINEKQTSEATKSAIPSLAEDEKHSTVAAMILRPVFYLHTYGRGMIDKITYYIQSSTSYYFHTDNGGMVVINIQNQPQVFVSSPNDYSEQNDEPDMTQPEQNDHTTNYHEHESWIVVRHGHHWLHCVSYKSGVPMWILSSILFLSSFFLLWLCCAAASPAKKRSRKTEKKAFLIREFLSASKEKDGQDVPLLGLDDTEKQAEPLPSKAAVISM